MSRLINFYSQIKSQDILNPNYDIHGIEIPFRMLVATASGGGKTNFILNLLYEMNNTFHKIYIITKAEEPLYTLLIERLNKLNNNVVEIFYDGIIPDFEKMDKGLNGLIIFDDMVLTNDNKIGENFIRGRKLGYSSIYISQSFFSTPKIIRQNINYVALGRGINKRDLRLILTEYSLGISLDELERYYFNLTKKHMHFMLLDLLKRNIRHNIINVIKEF